MSAATDHALLDIEARRAVYDHLIERATMPTAEELAEHLRRGVHEVRAALWRMKEAHVLVLQEGDREILMANPFSAVPTPFHVTIGHRSWWGNCIWDAMGIAAMVGGAAEIITGCGDCNDAMTVRIDGGRAQAEGGGIIHFSVPARRWWDNIKFT